jgi:isopenicillin-N N-acyltransferase-like protein
MTIAPAPVWVDRGLHAAALAAAPSHPLMLDVAGSPVEQGRAHGRAAATAIAANVAAVGRDIAQLCPDEPARERYRACLDANAAFVRRTAPATWAELESIAEGADVPLDDVLSLNLPAHMVLRWVAQECSQIAVEPARAGGARLLAKTRDMSGNFVQHVALRRRFPEGGALTEVTVAGSICWPGSGLNSHGVAMSTSGVWSEHTAVDWRRCADGWILINSHDLLRRSRTAAEFVELLRAQPRLSGLNMVVADQRETLALEVTRDAVVVRPAGDTHVLTNHYITDELAALSPTLAQNASSYARSARAAEVLAATGGTTVADLAALCADEQGGPQLSLARRQVDGVGSETTYASIAVLPELAFHVVLGNPADADRSGLPGARQETAT